MSDISQNIINDLAPSGRLRSTINLGNTVLALENPAGNLRGVSVDLARALGERLGLEVELVPFDTAGKAFDALRSGACDVGFLAIDPKRAEDLDYSAPYVIIEGTYLVPADSPFGTVDDLDRDGVRIAAGRNTAYDLHLSRVLQHARLVHYPSSAAAIEAALAGKTDAAAGVRQPLAASAARSRVFRVVEGNFLLIQQAMALPRNRPAGHEFIRSFMEEMKRSGFIADALARSGQGDAVVAPPA
ncbi:amino acid ABC transporter substrate-binding protein, PAAT family [Azospirillum oryzae]|uniref:Amino acid ABC transporter substrate-binding protein, PAAT family n=1 Tax=Azospirillum oryzae TaxID=286727 RepID=A0A1X7HQF0_9PROT|nr:ABC transporter substrate-binding protein [Azospirillum oryzae]SMF89905.1 amino acid ABC transporter substrate-binding protein, PAAT family [Azospirillum oryzae]